MKLQRRIFATAVHAVTCFCLVMILLVVFPAASAAQFFAYVTNRASDSVSVIEDASNSVVATIPVGDNPSGVAVSPDRSRVYVANGESSSLSVLDGVTFSVLTTVSLAGRPLGVARSPDGTRVYVALRESDGRLAVVDTTSHTVMAMVVVGRFPFGVAVHPAGTFVYVTNQESHTVSVIDATSLAVVATVPTGQPTEEHPQGIAITPDGTRIYVTNNSSGTVAVIDSASNTLVATLPLGSSLFGIAVHPAGAFAYAVMESGFVAVIDTATNTVAHTVPVGSDPRGVAVTPDGARVYVANTTGHSVSVIATASHSVIATIPVGTNPVAFGQFIGGTPEVGVVIDIKPGSFPNSINLGSEGNVPVAILSSSTFDARTVDPLSVTLASAPVRLRGNGTAIASADDVNGDGLLDLVVHVSTSALQLSEADTLAVLNGITSTGTLIRGSDSVRIVP